MRIGLIGLGEMGSEIGRSFVENGIEVINTPAASSQSVAELVMAQLFNISRSVYDSNRNMPSSTNGDFWLVA